MSHKVEVPVQEDEGVAVVGSRYGYTRTNRPDVDVERRHRALLDAGVQEQEIFIDFVVSGRNSAAQTQLRALLGTMRAGDTIVVDHLYRLGRDPIRVGELLVELKGRGIAIEVIEHASESDLMLVACAVDMVHPTTRPASFQGVPTLGAAGLAAAKAECSPCSLPSEWATSVPVLQIRVDRRQEQVMDEIGAVRDERLARVMLACAAGPGESHTSRLVQSVGVVETVRLALEPQTGDRSLEDQWRAWVAPRLSLDHARAAVEASERLGAQLLIPGDAAWPDRMDVLGVDGPVALWVFGDAACLQQSSVGIIGARAATRYGMDMAGELAADAVSNGLTVVSAGSYGISSAAHRAALLEGGTTVAVMPGGLGYLYPHGNLDIFEQMTRSGALVSEVPPDAVPTKWRFEQQGRLVAALSNAVVVVEAGTRSRSMMSASQAAEIGRPVAAVPGPVTSPASAGCHRLIQAGTAGLVASPVDLRVMLQRAGVHLSQARSADALERSAMPDRSGPTAEPGRAW